MDKNFFRDAREVLSEPPPWQPIPTEKQIRESRRLRLLAHVCAAICAVGAAEYFLFETWPAWVTYILGAFGFASWPLMIRSRLALESVNDGHLG
jgi:hypothetical protein